MLCKHHFSKNGQVFFHIFWVVTLIMQSRKGRQFNQSVITFAVGYYLRYNISYRDLVEMMRDRGIFVHHTTLMRWVQHYSPIMRALWRKRHRRTSKSWRMDETYIKIKGQWNYLYRALDDQGLTLDFQLRKKRDFNSAYRFLKRLLKTYGLPHRLVTDQYGATLKAIKKLTREGICTKVCISAPNIAII